MLPLPSAEVSTSWWVSLINMVRADDRQLLSGRFNWNINNINGEDRNQIEGR